MKHETLKPRDSNWLKLNDRMVETNKNTTTRPWKGVDRNAPTQPPRVSNAETALENHLSLLKYNIHVFYDPAVLLLFPQNKWKYMYPKVCKNVCKCVLSPSVVSGSLQPHGLQPASLPRPWGLKARILKWFAIPFSSGPHFVRALHHDPSFLGGPTWHGSIVSLS